MYPRDDEHLRVRLLIAQCRKARRKLEVRLAECREQQARRAGAETNSDPRPRTAPYARDLGRER